VLGWEEAVDIYLAFGAEVNLSVYDRRNGKAKGDAGAVALRVLFRGVELVVYVCGVVGVEDGLAGGRLVPVFEDAAQTMASFEPFAEMAGVAPESRNRAGPEAFRVSWAWSTAKSSRRVSLPIKNTFRFQ
jgi:hypothetical protein